MILNYRVVICRNCYFKRTRQCSYSDQYIQNNNQFPVQPGGECTHYISTPWLP